MINITKTTGYETMTAFERAEGWLKEEMAIIAEIQHRPNKFELCVPIEVREEFINSLSRGDVLHITTRHLKVWAAIADALGVSEFTKPLGWSQMEIKTHLLLNDGINRE